MGLGWLIVTVVLVLVTEALQLLDVVLSVIFEMVCNLPGLFSLTAILLSPCSFREPDSASASPLLTTFMSCELPFVFPVLAISESGDSSLAIDLTGRSQALAALAFDADFARLPFVLFPARLGVDPIICCNLEK